MQLNKISAVMAGEGPIAVTGCTLVTGKTFFNTKLICFNEFWPQLLEAAGEQEEEKSYCRNGLQCLIPLIFIEV